ncbi:MAG: hypothetical protein Q8K98_06075 [Bacteroidota bacterium]|nr:hypothetical protein [Bacteroidota bacterium]
MKTEKQKLLAAELKNKIVSLKKSANLLSYSVDKCRAIGNKNDYSIQELEAFDALTSRFARTSDLLTQKVFGLIDAILLEEPGTLIDKLNRAEKRGIITSALIFKEIRELRNLIAHEYVNEDLNTLFQSILKYSPILLTTVIAVESYTDTLFETDF